MLKACSDMLYSYPSDNCAVIFPQPNNPPRDPLQEFPTYLKHSNGQGLVSNYLNSTMFAQQVGKPFLMFETNTASCGGFPGISDTFASALWALDYGLQMTHSNFSGALLHAGGQNVSYNVGRLLLPYSVHSELIRRFAHDTALYRYARYIAFLSAPKAILICVASSRSSTDERVFFPSVDRRPDLLFRNGRCGGTWQVEHVAS